MTPKQNNGRPIDASGMPAIDPTQNVKDLMEASIRYNEKIQGLYAQLSDEKIKTMEREWVHQEKMAIMRVEYDKDTRRLESDRVDKIRSVDVANAAATAAQLLSAVTTLATTSQTTAATLRDQVQATAAAVASQTERQIQPILERLTLLEKSGNIAVGRQAYSDPQVAELVAEMRKAAIGTSERQGRAEGMSDTAKMIMAAMAFLATMAGLWTFANSGSDTVAPAPQIIYVPAPATGVPLPSTPQGAAMP